MTGHNVPPTPGGRNRTVTNMKVRVLDYGKETTVIVLVVETAGGQRAVVVDHDALMAGAHPAARVRLLAARADKAIRARLGLNPQSLTLYVNPLGDVQSPWEYDYECVTYPARVLKWDVTDSPDGPEAEWKARVEFFDGGHPLYTCGRLYGSTAAGRGPDAEDLDSIAGMIEDDLGIRVGPLTSRWAL